MARVPTKEVGAGMSRYFHLYADGKTVREISQEEYIDISRKWRGSSRPRRLVAVSQTGLWLSLIHI